MQRGFFNLNLPTMVPQSNLPKCGACGFYKRCTTPKMKVWGQGQRGILIVGGWPSERDDRKGRPLTNEHGQFLEQALAVHNVNLYRDCWSTNALICKPSGSLKTFTANVDHCRPNVLNVIRELKPKVIILLGLTPVNSVIGAIWDDKIGPMSKWHSWRIPSRKFNSWICPMWQPADVNNETGTLTDVIRNIWRKDLARACELTERPYREVPNVEKQIEIIESPRQAAKAIRDVIRRGGESAFDYETNMLKPDTDKAKIYSCSICWDGTWTFAFPMLGEAVEAVSAYLRAPIIKHGANIKFEERWTRRRLGHGVTNWGRDVVVDAHILDCRTGITSVKFQSLVRLGAGSYNTTVAPLLKAEGGNTLNRIHEIPLRRLLEYNAIDSLYEFQLMLHQDKEFKQRKKMR